MKIKNPSQLKHAYLDNNPEGHFFDYKTMRFFGDTMRNFRLEETEEHYILWRKEPVAEGLKGGFLFDKKTFDYIGSVN